jgi:beta-glucanase (GH16 family)
VPLALIVIAAAVITPALLSPAPRRTPAARGDIDLSGYRLTFSDEFSKLSATAKSPKGASTWYAYPPYGAAGNYSASTWDISALSAAGGILSNQASLVKGTGSAGNSWTSGNLSSVDTTGAGFSQKYGYFDARIKMPDSGTGAWPAFWLSTTNSIPGVVSKAVPHEEIDILEWYGVTHTAGAEQAFIQEATHNWNVDGSQNKAKGTYLYSPQTAMPSGAYPWEGFHNYGVKVDPVHITWFIDGVQTNQIPTPTKYLTSPFYIMLDYALGGGWPLTGMVSGSTMKVDWVRVYSLPEK